MGRRTVALVVVAILGLVGLASFRVAGAARDLQAANDLVDQAAEALTDGDLARATSALEDAESLLLDANEALRAAPELSVFAWVPGARQNLQGLHQALDVAGTSVHGGLRILRESPPLQSDAGTLEVSLSDGSVPLDAIARVRTELDRLTAELRTMLRGGSSSLLLPPVADARDRVLTEARTRHQELEILGRGLGLVHELAGGNGPRRYLIAVANTAEMRGSGGMILNYGILEGEDGTIDLTEFGRIDELALAAPVAADVVPDDYLARWAGFEPLRRFRQANLAADFTLVAPALEAMFTESTDLPVHGVIQIDPAGLAAVLTGVGPVEVPELGEVDAANVEALTLNEAYFRFPDVEQRSDVLGDVAEAAFRKLVDGEVPSLRRLAEALVSAVDARHVLMHASDPKVQEHLVAFGADGALPELDGRDSFALTAQNLSGNKLDYYLDTHLRLAGQRPPGGPGRLTATVTLTNGAPPGATAPAYVFGPFAGAAVQEAGLLRSVVTLYLPVGASLAAADGDPLVEPASFGTEGGRPYVSYLVDIRAGQTHTVQLELDLAPRPAGEYLVEIVPSPRVRPTTVEVEISTGGGTVAGDAELIRAWRFGEDADPAALVAPAFR
ncbi:MAG: DUF4012 domain-containing protein [Acidimicrobiia bacterium]|jgi:hypothetical protein